MDSKDLTIVIVTFKSESKIINCLNSIKDNVRIIVVENSNNKKFKNYLESKFQNVRCILTKENKGYSVANNIGLKQVSTKYALVLNPDTILDNNAIRNFLLSAEKNQEFWLMGPANAQMKNIEFKDNLAEVENIKGFAIFFNLLKFNQVFFDENFFLYFEEIDLCKRVRNKKGKIFLDKTIYINHQGACSVETVYKFELEKNRNWHWMWSTFYYHKKYKGFFYSLLIIFPKLLSAFFKMCLFSITFNKVKREIYFCRLSGIFNSIIGNKSWYRPSLD